MAKKKKEAAPRKSAPAPIQKTIDRRSMAYMFGITDKRLRELCDMGLPCFDDGGDMKDCFAWYNAHRDDEQKAADKELAVATLRSVAQGETSAVAQVNAARALIDYAKASELSEVKPVEIVAFIELANADGVIEATRIHGECPKCGHTIIDD